MYCHPSDPARCTLSPATVSEVLGFFVLPSLALFLGMGFLISGGLKAWTIRSSDEKHAGQNY